MPEPSTTLLRSMTMSGVLLPLEGSVVDYHTADKFKRDFLALCGIHGMEYSGSIVASEKRPEKARIWVPRIVDVYRASQASSVAPLEGDSPTPDVLGQGDSPPAQSREADAAATLLGEESPLQQRDGGANYTLIECVDCGHTHHLWHCHRAGNGG